MLQPPDVPIRVGRGRMLDMLRLRSSVVTVSITLCVLGAAASSTIARDEASSSPQAILAEVKRDLGKVKSFHFDGRMTDPSGVTRVSGDIFASGTASIGVTQDKATVRMILLSKSTYMKANAGYWKASGGVDDPRVVAKLAGRWVKVPESVRGSVRPLLAKLSPKHIASCISSATGTLTNNGVKSVGGRKAIVLEDKGERPGTAPGLLYIAADGPALPMRQVQTGPRRSGGKLDERCEESDDKSTAGVVAYSQYDRVPPLRAPRRFLSLPDPDRTV